MARQLAFCVCTVFVLWLLYIDRKQSQGVSVFMWIPTVYLMLIASKPLAIWFGLSGEDLEAGSPLDRVFLIVLISLALIILVKRRFKWSSAIKENIWLTLLVGYMLVSILWSDFPFMSFKRWTRELGTVFMAFLVSTEADPRSALQCIFRRTIYVLIPFSYILIHYFPEYGRMYGTWSGVLMWIGVTTQKNGLGRLCVFSSFFLIWTLIKNWRIRDIFVLRYQRYVDVFILFLTFWLMGGPQHSITYSATSTIVLVGGLLFFYGLVVMKRRSVLLSAKTLIVMVVLIIFYGTVTPFVGELTLIDLSSTFARDETLTGRSDIWETIVPFATRQPILGYGFGGFWTDEIRRLSHVSQSHNGYLDVVLNIGFLGLWLTTMFVIAYTRKAQRAMTRDFNWGALCICFVLMAVVHNITESSINTLTSQLIAVLIFLIGTLTGLKHESAEK